MTPAPERWMQEAADNRLRGTREVCEARRHKGKTPCPKCVDELVACLKRIRKEEKAARS